MTFLEAAKRVLSEAGTPLSADEIARRALEHDWISTKGATPGATMRAQLGTLVQRLGDEAEFVKVKRGLWGLKDWGAGEETTPPSSEEPRHWLFTTNPKMYDAEELFRKGSEIWGEMIDSGVVQKRIREEVRVGDTALVYRTKPVADLFCEVRVTKGPYPLGDKHVLEVEPIRRLDPPVPLRALRACPELAGLEFLHNSRVSISRVSAAEYEAIEGLIGRETEADEDYTHDAVQWMLIRLAKAFGCGVWIASDCRSRTHDGEAFADHCLADLPDLGFSKETTDLVRGIDVLWLRGNSVLAAFEIEHTTSIYSGLLRMSDLLSLQPNINIDLYIVAPASRRAQVARQLNRPTFDRLPRPLNQVCKLISYDGLEGLVTKVEGLAGFLQVDLIKTIAEDCGQ